MRAYASHETGYTMFFLSECSLNYEKWRALKKWKNGSVFFGRCHPIVHFVRINFSGMSKSKVYFGYQLSKNWFDILSNDFCIRQRLWDMTYEWWRIKSISFFLFRSMPSCGFAVCFWSLYKISCANFFCPETSSSATWRKLSKSNTWLPRDFKTHILLPTKKRRLKYKNSMRFLLNYQRGLRNKSKVTKTSFSRV